MKCLKLILLVVSLIALFGAPSLASDPLRDIGSLPRFVASAPAPAAMLPWRKGSEERDAKIESGIDQGIEALLRSQQEIIDLLKAKQAVAAPTVPVREKEVDKPSLAERLKDRVEARKDAVADTIDSIIESGFARRMAIVCAIVAAIWFAVKKHKKEGTPTHIERLVDRVATATAGVPVLGNITKAVDSVVDKTGDKIRELQDKIDAAKDKAHAETLKVALATPAPAQLAPVVPVAPAKTLVG